MRAINDLCIKKYKPDEDVIVLEATNEPWDDTHNFSKERMANFETGSLPPQRLCVKCGCSTMLLRNISLFDGNLMFCYFHTSNHILSGLD